MNPLSIRRAAEEHPERAALVVGADDGRSAETWSFARLAEAVEMRRADVGVRPVLVAEPGVETVLDLLVAFEAETTVVPLHARWSEAERKSFVDALRSGAPPESDALAVLATSGSTGEPKGVELSRRAFLASAEASERRLGWQSRDDEAGDRWLLGLPLAHVGGLSIVVRCLLARQAIVVPPTRPRFDAAELAGWLDAWGVTLLSLVPTQLRRLLDLDGWRPPASLRAVLLGGAAASPALLAEATSRGVPVRVTYGLTEACSQVATWSRDVESGSEDPGVGRPLDGVEVRIDDPDVEGIGTIAVCGPVLMTGYRPADGPGAGLDPDGFFRTSDLGRLDEKGFLHVLGRADDVIVTGGENVHPRAVEDVLEAHPSVARACVLGVSDAEWGQAVVAFVEPAAGREVDIEALPAELRVDLRSRLAAYAVPREIRVVDSLPTTASGKIDRRRLLAP